MVQVTMQSLLLPYEKRYKIHRTELLNTVDQNSSSNVCPRRVFPKRSMFHFYEWKKSCHFGKNGRHTVRRGDVNANNARDQAAE